MSFEMCSKHLYCVHIGCWLVDDLKVDNFKILLAGGEERVYFPLTSILWFRSLVIYQSARLNTKNYCMAGP